MKLVGLVGLASGGLIALMVTLRPEGLTSPSWVVYLTASAFVLAGGTALARAYQRNALAEACVCFLLGTMLLIELWITFAPRPQCTGGIAGLGFFTSDMSCRVAFGLGSVVVAVMLFLAVRCSLRRRATG